MTGTREGVGPEDFGKDPGLFRATDGDGRECVGRAYEEGTHPIEALAAYPEMVTALRHALGG